MLAQSRHGRSTRLSRSVCKHESTRPDGASRTAHRQAHSRDRRVPTPSVAVLLADRYLAQGCCAVMVGLVGPGIRLLADSLLPIRNSIHIRRAGDHCAVLACWALRKYVRLCRHSSWARRRMRFSAGSFPLAKSSFTWASASWCHCSRRASALCICVSNRCVRAAC